MFLRAVVCVLTIDTDTKASRFFELKASRRLRRLNTADLPLDKLITLLSDLELAELRIRSGVNLADV